MRICAATLVVAGHAACASAGDERDALAPCARARLAREFVAGAPFQGCYQVSEGPAALQNVGVVVLSDAPLDHLDDEPPKYALSTTRPLVAAPASLKERARSPVTTSWEQLSSTQARLVWLQGIRGLEACVAGGAGGADHVRDGSVLDGSVFVVDDVAPYAHPAGRLVLTRTICPQ